MINKEYAKKQLVALQQQANGFLASYNQAVGAIAAINHLLETAQAVEQVPQSVPDDVVEQVQAIVDGTHPEFRQIPT